MPNEGTMTLITEWQTGRRYFGEVFPYRVRNVLVMLFRIPEITGWVTRSWMIICVNQVVPSDSATSLSAIEGR